MNIRSIVLLSALLLAPGLAYANKIEVTVGGKTVALETGKLLLLENLVKECGSKVTADQIFKAIIEKCVVFVDFFATWCGPCKTLATNLHDIAPDYQNTDIIFLKVDVDKFDSISSAQGINAMPTIKFFKHSQKPVFETTGSQSKKILKQLIAQHLEKKTK